MKPCPEGPKGARGAACPTRGGVARALSRSEQEGLEAEAEALPARFRRALRQLSVPGRALVARDLGAVLHVHGPLPHRRLAALGVRRALIGGRHHGRRRLRRAAGAGAVGVPRDRRRRLAEEVGAGGHVPRPLRQRNRQPRHQAQRFDPAVGVPGFADQGDARDRGPAVLRAFRHRHSGHDAGARHQHPGRRRPPGRLLDHPAIGEEPVPDERAHHRAQGEGGVSRAVARVPPHQERDPETLPRPRLSRRRRVRRRCRRAILLQQIRPRREPLRSRHARRPVQGARQIRPAHQPAGRPRPRQRRLGQSRRIRLHDRRPGLRRPPQPRHGS